MLGRAGWTATYHASGGVSDLTMGRRRLLFSETSQQIRELNETAGLIWDGLAGGLTPAVVSARLADSGTTAEEAAAFVDGLLQQWLCGGELYPDCVEEARRSPEAVAPFASGGLSLAVGLHGGTLREDFAAVFGQFSGPVGAETPSDYQLVESEGFAFLFRGERCLGAAPEGGAMPLLKGVLTEAVIDSLEAGFAAHAGCLIRGDAAWLVAGSPGAGKTTLCAALAAKGFRYATDDVSLVDAAGEVSGVPFALAVKAGSWPLLEPMLPALACARTHLRADGQEVRYVLPPDGVTRKAARLQTVIALAREAGATARLDVVDPADMLAILLAESYAPSRSLTAAQFEITGQAISAARCCKLTYSDLAEAVELLSGGP